MTSSLLINYIDEISKFENNYSEIFVKHLSKSIFDNELSKLSSIDTKIDEEKINNKNYTQLKNKLKKILVSVDIKKFIDNINYSTLNIEEPSINNNIILLQCFHYLNKMCIQDEETLTLLLMDFNNNLYKNIPKHGRINNLTNRSSRDIINFKKYIFEDTYDAFWQTNYEDKIKFYNFVKKFDNDIIYIKIIKDMNNNFIKKRHFKCNLASNLYRFLGLNRDINFNMINTQNFLSNQYNHTPGGTINNLIIEYFTVKNNFEYNYLLKIINCYNNIKPQIEDNKILFSIFSEFQFQKINNTFNEEQYQLFTKMFYDNIEEYWLKNIEKPIFFNETSDYLFDINSWNITSEQYLNVLELIEEVTVEISKKIIKKEKKKESKTISKALKSRVWNKYIGKEKGTNKCFCCDDKDICQMDFECGHVIAKANGGGNTTENLRPICGLCNKSMGTTHMFKFMNENGFKKK